MSRKGPSGPLPSLTSDQEADVRRAMPMVDKLAAKMESRHPQLTAKEYASLGYEALWRSRLDFDASRGAEFTTYAWPRIGGAMIDGLRQHRSQDPVRVVAKILGLESLSGFQDAVDPFGETDDDRVARLTRHCQAGTLEMAAVFGCLTWREQGEAGLLQHLDRARATEELTGARAALDEEAAAIVEMRFENELALPAMASLLGVSESTVKRRVADVRERLRRDLRARGVIEAPAVENR